MYEKTMQITVTQFHKHSQINNHNETGLPSGVTELRKNVFGDIVSQKVSWLPRTSKNCLRHGLDSITEKVKITRKENKYETLNFIAKGASFEFLSSPLCELSNLHTAYMPCGRNISSICYCESSTEEEIIIVLNMTADVKYSKQNISVTVPCIHKEKSTRKQRELQTIITYKYVFKLNGQVVQDLSSVLYHHGPFHIELCCIQEIADFPCTSTISYHTKNVSETPCVSIIENPSKVTNYTLSIEVCDKIQIIRNATIHPLSDNSNNNTDYPWLMSAIISVAVICAWHFCLWLNKKCSLLNKVQTLWKKTTRC
ncbi:uncharacterized protein LOC129922835 isoform X3 [Biomphalaria glabrata]|uniref:Uncharacterized protein LOC129922835 isoform X3 n=1 Tax=Biomphalaria glabrata TaxID=6526 RepID=A0A9W2YUP2_BIOGL|nr:uncharacterized protein LOC129922835 isoform X3 [Biomphalaria glabrata]